MFVGRMFWILWCELYLSAIRDYSFVIGNVGKHLGTVTLGCFVLQLALISRAYYISLEADERKSQLYHSGKNF